MVTIMAYLPLLEQLRLQVLDKWWYDIGVSRVQWCFVLPPKVVYLYNDGFTAIDVTGESRQLDCKGEPYYYEPNNKWFSC